MVIAYGLGYISPVFQLINILLIIAGLVACIPSFLTSIKRQKAIWLFLVLYFFVLFIGKTCLIPTSHRVYGDEDAYEAIAMGIAHEMRGHHPSFTTLKEGKAHIISGQYSYEPIAYPSLLSVAFRIFGPNEKVAFCFNRILSSLTPVLVGLLAGALFNSTAIIFFACLLYGLLPPHLAFGNSATVEISTVFFCVLTFLTFIFQKKKPEEGRRTFLAISVLALTIQFRAETVLILPVIGYLYLLPSKGKIIDALDANAKWIVCFSVLTFAHGLHLYVHAKEYDPGMGEGIGFSLKYFWPHFKTNTLYFLNNARMPSLYTLLSFVSLLTLNRFPKALKALWLWFFLFWGLMIFYYLGGVSSSHDSERYSLTALIPFCLLSSQGVNMIYSRIPSKFIRLVILLTFVSLTAQTYIYWDSITKRPMPYLDLEKNHYFLEKSIPQLPEDAMIITAFPGLALILGRSSAFYSFFDPQDPSGNERALHYKKSLYLHKEMMFKDEKELARQFNKILEAYSHSLIHEMKVGGKMFALYQIYP